MLEFEFTHQPNENREENLPIERHVSIELSDKDHLEKIRPSLLSKEMKEAGFVYKEYTEEEIEMSPALKEKFNKARMITKDTKVINPWKKNEKSKSKSPKGKPKKIHPKPD